MSHNISPKRPRGSRLDAILTEANRLKGIEDELNEATVTGREAIFQKLDFGDKILMMNEDEIAAAFQRSMESIATRYTEEELRDMGLLEPPLDPEDSLSV